ncbi:MAG: DEAD/DEAH box helicase [Metallosphaera sp.]|uniref:DEAD/DEAH box helicase n=1 Tax=Metallosphaera sp. TaxID=2020860 RepID=UPI00316BAB9E
MSFLETFSEEIKERLGFSPYPYQKTVINDILRALGQSKFLVVSMPTGSGKTLIELFVASQLASEGMRVLVLEPTRLLCDQMYHNFWSKVFDDVGEEYEGNCESFERGKRVIVSTPITSAKCTPKVDAVIIDEVHHAFGDPRYISAIVSMSPKLVIGFTALLPSNKRYRVDSKLIQTLGAPSFLTYDFRKLSEIDPTFVLPKAIADVFDADMNGVENVAYEALLKNKVRGDYQALGFLRYTLYSNGKEAFCESLENLKDRVSDNLPFSNLCSSTDLGHKARSLKDILNSYDIEEHKPILIFTSRRSTAHEFEIVLHNLGVKRVKTLTGELKKEERLKIVDEAKRGLVDVIISTHVGEEGIDIPEAKLLIMTDVPKSPLRFYQRLGRLIRKTNETVKYLVVTLTPKTPEYDDLDEALFSLSREGVDVSYIIESKTGKGTTSRIVDQVKDGGGEVPLTKLLELNYELKDYILLKGFNLLNLTSPEDGSPYADFIDRSLSEGELFYYYRPDSAGEVIAKIMLSKYCQLCYGDQCRGLCNEELIKLGRQKQYKLMKKELLRFFMVLFTKEKITEVENNLVSKKYDNPNFRYMIQTNVNERNKSVNFRVELDASINGITVYPMVSIAFYNVDKSMTDFLKNNVRAICEEAGKKFFSYFTS